MTLLKNQVTTQTKKIEKHEQAPIDFSIENNQSSTIVNIDTNVNTKEINQKRKMLEQKLEENTLAMKKIFKSR